MPGTPKRGRGRGAVTRRKAAAAVATTDDTTDIKSEQDEAETVTDDAIKDIGVENTDEASDDVKTDPDNINTEQVDKEDMAVESNDVNIVIKEEYMVVDNEEGNKDSMVEEIKEEPTVKDTSTVKEKPITDVKTSVEDTLKVSIETSEVDDNKSDPERQDEPKTSTKSEMEIDQNEKIDEPSQEPVIQVESSQTCAGTTLAGEINKDESETTVTDEKNNQLSNVPCTNVAESEDQPIKDEPSQVSESKDQPTKSEASNEKDKVVETVKEQPKDVADSGEDPKQTTTSKEQSKETTVSTVKTETKNVKGEANITSQAVKKSNPAILSPNISKVSEEDDRPFPASLAKVRQLKVNIGPIKQFDLKSEKLHEVLRLTDTFEIKFELRDSKSKDTKKHDDVIVQEKIGFVRIPFEIRTPNFLIRVANILGNLHIDGKNMSVTFPDAFNKALKDCKAYMDETNKIKAKQAELKKRQIVVKNVPPNVTEETIRSLFPEAKKITLSIEESKKGEKKVGGVLLEYSTEADSINCFNTNKDVFIEDCQLVISRLVKTPPPKVKSYWFCKGTTTSSRGRGFGNASKIKSKFGVGSLRGRPAAPGPSRGSIRGSLGSGRGMGRGSSKFPKKEVGRGSNVSNKPKPQDNRPVISKTGGQFDSLEPRISRGRIRNRQRGANRGGKVNPSAASFKQPASQSTPRSDSRPRSSPFRNETSRFKSPVQPDNSSRQSSSRDNRQSRSPASSVKSGSYRNEQKFSPGRSPQSSRPGQQSSRPSQQSPIRGQQSARQGQQSARQGQQSARQGQQSARQGQQSSRQGQQSARNRQQSPRPGQFARNRQQSPRRGQQSVRPGQQSKQSPRQGQKSSMSGQLPSRPGQQSSRLDQQSSRLDQQFPNIDEGDPMAMMAFLKTTIETMAQKFSQPGSSDRNQDRYDDNSPVRGRRGQGSNSQGQGHGRGNNMSRKRNAVDDRDFSMEAKRPYLTDGYGSRDTYGNRDTLDYSSGNRRESFTQGYDYEDNRISSNTGMKHGTFNRPAQNYGQISSSNFTQSLSGNMLGQNSSDNFTLSRSADMYGRFDDSRFNDNNFGQSMTNNYTSRGIVQNSGANSGFSSVGGIGGSAMGLGGSGIGRQNQRW